MSYITTKCGSLLRSRLLVGHVKHSLNYTSGAQVKAVSNIEKQHSHYGGYRISNILKTLSSNKISLQFDDFSYIPSKTFKNYGITSEAGFEILKSCSQLVSRSTEDRIKLVANAWNELTLQKQPTKDQLIQLLQAYRRTGMKSLDDFESVFAKYNCPIDAEIYAELLYITCQNDTSMKKAEALLNHARAKNVKITDKMYNALILGYSKQGIEAVEKVLETMKSDGITPTMDTNMELVKAYFTNGNNDKAIGFLLQSGEFNITQLYDIIRNAAMAGNELVVAKALNLLPEPIQRAKQIVQDLQNICIEVVHANRNRSPDAKLDVYKLIIRHLPVPTFGMEDTTEYGTFLLKEMIVTGESVPNILRLCDDLKGSNRNTYAIHFCCMYSSTLNLPIGREFLEALSAKEKLRPHYFWPLLVHTHNQNEVLEIVSFANKLKTTFDTQTLIDWVLPRTNALIDSQAVVQCLIESGVRMLELKTAVITFLLNHNRAKEALDMSVKSGAIIDPTFIKPALVKFIKGPKYNKNSHTVATIVKKMQFKCIDKSYDLAGQVVLSICDKTDIHDKCAATEHLLTEYHKRNVKFSRSSANTLLENIRRFHVENNIIERIPGFIDHEHFDEHQNDSIASKNISDIELLENQLVEFQSKGFPTHGVLYRLFSQLIRTGKYDRAIEIKKQCDQAGVIETPAMLSNMLKLYTATGEFVKAMHTLKTLMDKHPKFKVDMYKIIDLLALLYSKDKPEHAGKLIDTIEQCKDKNIKYIERNVWDLLTAVKDYSIRHNVSENMSGKLLNTLIKLGYCTPSNVLLGTVIKEYLEKKNIHEAVAAFEHYVKEYEKTPLSLTLLQLLIELSNGVNADEYSASKEETVEYIQRIITLINEQHGAENANVTVILAFAGAGMDHQLRKILMNPAVKFNSDMLMKSLKYLKDKSKIETVVTIGRCAVGLKHTDLNEENIYDLLLTDFVRTNDYASAVEFFNVISVNGSVSKKFCKRLIDLLKKNEQPVPDQLRIKSY